MHSVYGRLLSRSIVNGLYNCSSSSSSSSSRTNVTINATESTLNKSKPKLVSAVAGFPKSFKSGKVRKGQIGDDAWIITNTDSADVLGKCFSSNTNHTKCISLFLTLLAVADGVGGWRDYGVDPSDFSYSLLRSIERITSVNNPCNFRNPVDLLSAAFYELLHSKRPITGKFLINFMLLELSINHFFQLHPQEAALLVFLFWNMSLITCSLSILEILVFWL